MKRKNYLLTFALIMMFCIAVCVFTDYVQIKWAEKAYALELNENY